MIQILLATIVFTLILFAIPNKSNTSDYIMIPLIVCLLLKYILGDIDKGSIITIYDFIYFGVIILTSILLIFCLNKLAK